MSLALQSALARARRSLRLADLTSTKLLEAALITLCIGVIATRVSLALGSPVALGALLAAPIAISARSAALALASLMAVVIVALAVLPALAGGAHTAAFFFTGSATLGAFAYFAMAAGSRVAEARYALGRTRERAQRARAAVSRAGVCLVVLNHRLTWVEANDAAWVAFGCDPRVTRGADGRVEIDDEAASALMHSGSREAWRQLVEQVKADMTYRGRAPSRPVHGLKPYTTTLHGITGEPRTYQFTVTVAERRELVFVGFPVLGESSAPADADAVITDWLQDVVESMEEPAVVLQSDGAVVVANATFRRLAGGILPGARIFDLRSVSGVSEASFLSNVWSSTRHGAAAISEMRLEGGGEGFGARLVPPGAPHLESVLVLFRNDAGPLPQAFSELTAPADLYP